MKLVKVHVFFTLAVILDKDVICVLDNFELSFPCVCFFFPQLTIKYLITVQLFRLPRETGDFSSTLNEFDHVTSGYCLVIDTTW